LQIMQVKNFGRRGQTKYTHLVDQDTSVRDDYYSQDTVPKKGRRQAGTDQVFEKPKKFNT
jgi:microfibrillar-associated protein 1